MASQLRHLRCLALARRYSRHYHWLDRLLRHLAIQQAREQRKGEQEAAVDAEGEALLLYIRGFDRLVLVVLEKHQSECLHEDMNGGYVWGQIHHAYSNCRNNCEWKRDMKRRILQYIRWFTSEISDKLHRHGRMFLSCLGRDMYTITTVPHHVLCKSSLLVEMGVVSGKAGW